MALYSTLHSSEALERPPGRRVDEDCRGDGSASGRRAGRVEEERRRIEKGWTGREGSPRKQGCQEAEPIELQITKKEEKEKGEERQRRRQKEGERQEGHSGREKPHRGVWKDGIGPTTWDSSQDASKSQEGSKEEREERQFFIQQELDFGEQWLRGRRRIEHFRRGDQSKVGMGQSARSFDLGAISQMQTSLVRQSGEPWELTQDQVPPIFSQYWRQFLHPKMSGPMNREVQTICFAQDLLIQGRIAQACDVLTQRVKSLEQISGGSDYRISQRQELAPHEVSSLSTNVETLDASRLHREELKAKAASSRGGWERRKGDQDHWEVKGKGKNKDSKGKGKKGNWKKGDEREEKDQKKKGD